MAQYLIEGKLANGNQAEVIDEGDGGSNPTIPTGVIAKLRGWFYNPDASATVKIDLIRDVGGDDSNEITMCTIELGPKEDKTTVMWYPMIQGDNIDMDSDNASGFCHYQLMVDV